MTYVELQVATHFSFLRGVSSADELFAAARLLGYEALGVTDRNSVGGLVKVLRAEREKGAICGSSIINISTALRATCGQGWGGS